MGDQPRQTATLRTRRVIHDSYTTHGGTRRFANLLMTKGADSIVLDPHAAGCRIELDESEAAALRDALTEWLT